MLTPLASSSRFRHLLSIPHLAVAATIPVSTRVVFPHRRVRLTPVRPEQLRGGVTCRAEFAQDAPYAAAIGACILSSLAFPVGPRAPDGEDDGGGRMVDARLGVMAVISIIPYFNWLCWVFAWLDSEEWRYLVYSLVYLTPYLRTNFSLSTDDSWLPISSIILCIIHVQLETSIRNGDIEGFSFGLFLKKVLKKSHLEVSKTHKKVSKMDPSVLPSAEDESREKIADLENPKNSVEKQELLDVVESDNEERR